MGRRLVAIVGSKASRHADGIVPVNRVHKRVMTALGSACDAIPTSFWPLGH